MTFRTSILVTALLWPSSNLLAQQVRVVSETGYTLENGKLVPMSKEQTICALMRQQNIDRTSVCDESYARQAGLSITQCTALYKTSAELCDIYAQSRIHEPLTASQCLAATDRHHKCALVITVGCEYTKPLADKLEAISGIRDVDAISKAIKSECPRPDKKAMASKAIEGTLRVFAMSGEPSERSPDAVK